MREVQSHQVVLRVSEPLRAEIEADCIRLLISDAIAARRATQRGMQA